MTAAIVLAAGLSRRFGEANKLLHLIEGRPMAGRVAALVARLPLAEKVAVVSDDRVAALFAEQGFTLVPNYTPQAGLGRSLALGRAALGGAGRVLVCLGDMPFVTLEHLRRLLSESTGHQMLASAAEAYRGPPLVVARARLDATALAGDEGLRPLLRDARLLKATRGVLRDIDTLADFSA